jgi:hypothetical protein
MALAVPMIFSSLDLGIYGFLKNASPASIK